MTVSDDFPRGDLVADVWVEFGAGVCAGEVGVAEFGGAAWGPLRRNGIVNPFWGHRDETRVLVGVGL